VQEPDFVGGKPATIAWRNRGMAAVEVFAGMRFKASTALWGTSRLVRLPAPRAHAG